MNSIRPHASPKMNVLSIAKKCELVQVERDLKRAGDNYTASALEIQRAKTQQAQLAARNTHKHWQEVVWYLTARRDTLLQSIAKESEPA